MGEEKYRKYLNKSRNNSRKCAAWRKTYTI